MTDARREAVEEAEDALNASDTRATWTLTLEELYDKASEDAPGGVRLATAAERIATALESIAGSLEVEGDHGRRVGLAGLIAKVTNYN